MLNGEKTRLYVSLLLSALALAEGLLKSFIPGFPLTEVLSFQAVAFGGSVTARTISNIDEAKYEKPE